MADSAVETKEVASTVVEKEAVSSSVKESPVKESNGTDKENGKGDAAEPQGEAEEVPKENGDEAKVEESEVKENGDSTEDACAIKRKSCSGDADTPSVVTPEKKAKLAEEEDSPVAEESNDAEAVEA